MRVTILNTARAPYLCALQEAFAGSLGDAGQLTLFWPEGAVRTFDESTITPYGPNISVDFVAAPELPQPLRWIANKLRGHRTPTQLPSLSLWKSIHKSKPQLIWIHELSPWALVGLLYALWYSLPVVVSSEVGLHNQYCFSPMVRAWHGFWGKLADGFIACCPAARQPLCGGNPPVVDAFHAVDSRVFRPLESKPISTRVCFAYLGQFIPRKGLDLLFAAAAALKQSHGDVFELMLIGKDSTGYAAELVNKLDLEPQVTMTGFLNGDALRHTLASADVFILPTRQDTYAAVVHEAACLSLPLLISKHAGAAEALVIEGVTGYSFTPENIEDMSHCMARVLHSAVRHPMALAARAKAEELSAHVRGPAIAEWMRRNFQA
jgi:glycosyltransferase involved in cell wall biosynthesis